MTEKAKLRSLEAISNIQEREPRKYRIHFDEPSKTKQSERDLVDINSIVAKYLKTGEMPGMKGLPTYGDVSAAPTLHESLNLVRDTEAAFATLPARVREAVGNDPEQLLALVSDPERIDEAIELGLVEAPPPEPVAPAPTPAPEGGDTPPITEGNPPATP